MITEVIDVEGLKRLSGNDKSFVSEILKLYTERTAKDIQELESARNIQDWNGVRFVVHRMRSAAVPLGLKELVVLLRRAENQLREGDFNDIDVQLDRICSIANHALQDAQVKLSEA